jgi:hypothetical protein
MANYVAAARSNRFAVRDREAFLAWVGTIPGLYAESEGCRDGAERFVLLADEDGWPTHRLPACGDDCEEEFDLFAELSERLAEGEVAVLVESGHEKLRYVGGYAAAVVHRGEKLSVSLDDIYSMVEEAGWAGRVDVAAH